MNERIKQLWSKAAESNFGDSWEEQTKFMERFALLIVIKCAEIADTAEPFLASDLIKEHFGVEE
jgi:hypothetical protein